MSRVMTRRPFWAEGLQFQCQGSGKCCVSRGSYGHVFLTKEDRTTLACFFGISLAAFNKQYCDRSGGRWKLKDANAGECIFLKDKRCSAYFARPTQCRTWPFWPEVLNAKTWNSEVANFCPGIGKGKLWSPQEIEEQMAIQVAAETVP